MRKESKRYAIFEMKCPRCHEGDLFHNSSFAFKKSFEMPDKCPVCNQKYVLETGFYWGAMFISYAITSIYMLGGFAFCYFGLGLSVNASFAWLIILLTICYVWVFRFSRALWINWFIKYDPNWKQITQ